MGLLCQSYMLPLFFDGLHSYLVGMKRRTSRCFTCKRDNSYFLRYLKNHNAVRRFSCKLTDFCGGKLPRLGYCHFRGQAAQVMLPCPSALPIQRKIGNSRYYEYSNDCSIGISIKSDKLFFLFGIKPTRSSEVGASLKGHDTWVPTSSHPTKDIFWHIKSVYPCFCYKDFYLKWLKYL